MYTDMMQSMFLNVVHALAMESSVDNKIKFWLSCLSFILTENMLK